MIRPERRNSLGPLILATWVVAVNGCNNSPRAGTAPLYPECGVAFVEDWRIGVLDEPDEQRFSSITSFDVSEGGDVYVLDGIDASVKVFRSTTAWVRTFGGHGPGPGELSTPSRIAVSHGRVFVIDAGRNAITTFDSAGSYVGSHPLEFQPAGPRFLAADSAYLYVTGRAPTGDLDGPLLQIYDHQLHLLASFGRFAISEDQLEATQLAAARVAPGANGVWLMPLFAYDLSLYSTAGQERLSVPRVHSFPFLASQATREEAGRTGFNLRRAFVLGLFSHPNGTVWVSVQDNIHDRRTTDIFDPAGQWLVSMDASGRALPWHIGADGYAYRSTDEHGFPEIIRYRIVPEGIDGCADKLGL